MTTPDIPSALTELEREYGVRVLYAAESGSRAWGFASPDSDYDARLVYAHPRAWYLRVFEGRDVIERMLPHDLDLSGWDLRKALRLFARCNIALNEWLLSPIVYRDGGTFASTLRERMPAYFQPAGALFHYLGTARTTYADHLSSEAVRLKKVFYFLRPIFACRWIEHARSQPPTEFHKLMAASWVSEDERAVVAELTRRKLLASERDSEALDPSLRQWMQQQLEHFERIGPSLARHRDVDNTDLDALLAAVLEETV